jgi:hypothetical protein
MLKVSTPMESMPKRRRIIKGYNKKMIKTRKLWK